MKKARKIEFLGFFVIFIGRLHSSIEMKCIELEIRFWRHSKVNMKLFNLQMDIKYLGSS